MAYEYSEDFGEDLLDDALFRPIESKRSTRPIQMHPSSPPPSAEPARRAPAPTQLLSGRWTRPQSTSRTPTRAPLRTESRLDESSPLQDTIASVMVTPPSYAQLVMDRKRMIAGRTPKKTDRVARAAAMRDSWKRDPYLHRSSTAKFNVASRSNIGAGSRQEVEWGIKTHSRQLIPQYASPADTRRDDVRLQTRRRLMGC